MFAVSAGSCSGDAGNVNRWGDARRNFDFLIGTRDVRKSRLRECLKGSDRWDDFEARSVSRHVLGGLGSIDRIAFGRSFIGQEAMTLRLFDPAAREWGLHWADSSTSKIFTRLVGSFTEGRGVFYAREVFEGWQIFSRYIWSDIPASGCRWEQAFSDDPGSTLETSWTMSIARSSQDEPF